MQNKGMMKIGDLLQKVLIIGMIVSLPNSNIANSSHDDIFICLNIPIPGLCNYDSFIRE